MRKKHNAESIATTAPATAQTKTIDTSKGKSTLQLSNPTGKAHTVTVILYDDVWERLQNVRQEWYGNLVPTSTLTAALVRRGLEALCRD